MKYRFITCLHNLILDDESDSGEPDNSNGKISANVDILNQTFSNQLSLDTFGVHSLDEFKGRSFYYLDGKLDDIREDNNLHNKANNFTFAALRIIQNFIFDLWKVKDNNIYVYDGFLILYESEFNDGWTFKASTPGITCKSDLSETGTRFLCKEINQLIQNLEVDFLELFNDPKDYRKVTHTNFFKSSKLNRKERAMYFIMAARRNHTLPMKIVSYCTGLECLFTTSQTELSHRISERVASLVEGDKDQKIETYNTVKTAYNVRSTVVHGAVLKGTHDDLVKLSIRLDDLLRSFMTKEYDVFTKSNEEINAFFLKQLL